MARAAAAGERQKEICIGLVSVFSECMGKGMAAYKIGKRVKLGAHE